MKTAKSGRKPKIKHTDDDRERSLKTVCAVTCAVAVIMLSFTALDCESYEGAEECIPTSITYTPPKRSEGKGFWDIFTEAVTDLFSGIN